MEGESTEEELSEEDPLEDIAHDEDSGKANMNFKTLTCTCGPCIRGFLDTRKPNDLCILQDRAMNHIEEVADLLNFGAIVTIITEPDNTEVLCHRVLLEYYSNLLDDQSFELLPFIIIPEDIEVISLFVDWLYTGSLDRTDHDELIELACSLWVFGIRIGAPLFVNDVVHLICDYFMQYALNADIALLVYETTPKYSKLRALITDTIGARGPLSLTLPGVDLTGYYEEWRDLICDGGEIVENASHGFHNKSEAQEPWNPDRRFAYLEDEPKRDSERWMEGWLLRYVEQSYILRLMRGEYEEIHGATNRGREIYDAKGKAPLCLNGAW